MPVRPLDGLHKTTARVEPSTPRRGSPNQAPRHRKRWLVGFGLLIVLVVGWVQPLWAAVPVDHWSDRLTLAGLARPGVYLVLFQNPRELRPTGGFLGSFAEVELGWGFTLKKLAVETNIYLRDKLMTSQLAVDPPEPLHGFIGDQPWRMRDSNWALDFPEAAQTVSWFYEQEGGRPVDGVIGVDARLLERLLRVTGPIELESYGKIVTAESVIDDLQVAVEKEYWADPDHQSENQPKAILADLVPILLGRLVRVPTWQLKAALTAAAAEKEVMVAVRNSDLGAIFAAANWDGHVPKTTGDYLYLNEANLTSVDTRAKLEGTKSSWSIDRSATLLTTATTTGGSLHHLTYTRSHIGERVWPDGPNHSYLRLAVPSGSILKKITKNGQDILGEVRVSQEAGKTVFGVWSRLNPGESDILSYHYETPRGLDARLYLERQPGMPAYPVEIWDGTKLRWSGNLTTDQVLTD